MVSDRDIAGYAALVLGADSDKVKIATAIAIAESGGNEKAHNRNASTRDDSYGLWQINMYGDLGPSRRRQFGISSNSELLDPVVNAKAMDAISSDGTNWTPWSVYPTKYRQYLDRAAAATEGITGTVGNPIDDVAGAINEINPVEAFKSLIAPIQRFFGIMFDLALWMGNPQNWIRLLQVSGGVTLALVAAAIVAKPTVVKYGGRSIPALKGLR